jgi:hypothetical protein
LPRLSQFDISVIMKTRKLSMRYPHLHKGPDRRSTRTDRSALQKHLYGMSSEELAHPQKKKTG